MVSPFTALIALGAPPKTIEGVIDAMREIDARLEDGDGVKWFNRLYLRVTEAVMQSLSRSPESWRDPEWTFALDIEFARLYFEALTKGESDAHQAPSAWRPLIDCRHRRDLAPIQFAFAGMNAHINRDLPVAVESVSARLGRRVASNSRQHADYLAVNGILERVEAHAKAEFSEGLVGIADEALGRLDDVAAMWSVSRARDAAWTNAETLYRLRRFPRLQGEFLKSLDRFTGFAGRGLLVPVLLS